MNINTPAEKILHYKGINACLFAIEGDRLMANVCITLPQTYEITVQADPIKIPHTDETTASAIRFMSCVGNCKLSST